MIGRGRGREGGCIDIFSDRSAAELEAETGRRGRKRLNAPPWRKLCAARGQTGPDTNNGRWSAKIYSLQLPIMKRNTRIATRPTCSPIWHRSEPRDFESRPNRVSILFNSRCFKYYNHNFGGLSLIQIYLKLFEKRLWYYEILFSLSL